MNQLIQFLAQGKHPVKVVLKPEATLSEFILCLRRKFLNIMFMDTRGGTELGITIIESSVSADDISEFIKSIVVEGECGLNFKKIKVKVEVSLIDFSGTAQVNLAEE